MTHKIKLGIYWSNWGDWWQICYCNSRT